MRLLLIVFLGGGLGSISRYLLHKEITEVFKHDFPLGTFIINILGCFLIGIILTISEKFTDIPVTWKLFLATGFCGGFTTFSAFAFENRTLIQNKEILLFVVYTTLSVGLGLLATFTGIFLVKKFL